MFRFNETVPVMARKDARSKNTTDSLSCFNETVPVMARKEGQQIVGSYTDYELQ